MVSNYDYDQFPKDFFQTIFGKTVETEKLCIELLFRRNGAGGSSKRNAFFKRYRALRQMEQDWPRIRKINEEGFDVDFTVVARKPDSNPNSKGLPLPDRPVVTCLWADIDVGKGKPFADWMEAFEHLRTIKPLPTAVVHSGGGLHAYFVLKTPQRVPPEKAREDLVAVARRLHAEVGSPTQIKRRMRVPNTINHKYGESARFFIIGRRRRYSLATLRQKWDISAPQGYDASPGNNSIENRGNDFLLAFRGVIRGLKHAGNQKWAHGLCPFPHGDRHEKNASFYLNLKTGKWGCHACRRKGIANDLLGPALLAVGNDHSITWATVPAFDPSHVAKTKWLIKDVLPVRNIALIYGPRGSLKSSRILSYLTSISKKRRVLYLDYENPSDVLKRLDNDLGLNLTGNPTFKLWDRFGTSVPPRPGDPALEKLVLDAIRQTKRSPVLVFDSWGSLLKAGEGGESTGQVAPIYAHLRRLCDLGATIIILDHTRKYSPDIIYGGEDKEAKSDVIHNFILHEDKARPGRPILEVKSWLKRHAPKGVSSCAFRVNGGKDKKGVWHVYGFEPCSDPGVEERRKQRKIMRNLILQYPNGSQEELVKLAAPVLSRNKAREVLKKGVERNLWEVRKAGHGKTVFKLTG